MAAATTLATSDAVTPVEADTVAPVEAAAVALVSTAAMVFASPRHTLITNAAPASLLALPGEQAQRRGHVQGGNRKEPTDCT